MNFSMNLPHFISFWLTDYSMLSMNQIRYRRCRKRIETLGIGSKNDSMNLVYAGEKKIILSCCYCFRSWHWTALHSQQAYNRAQEYKGTRGLALLIELLKEDKNMQCLSYSNPFWISPFQLSESLR